MTPDSSGVRTRVVVSDADPLLRAAMTDRLRAAGYEVVQIDHLGAQLPPDLRADYAVMRCLAREMGGLAGAEWSDGTSPKLTIGWLRRGWSHAASLAAAEAQREEHAVRIFAAIAPLFIDSDREGAERLARGVHALRSTIWGASASAAASGDHAGSARDELD